MKKGGVIIFCVVISILLTISGCATESVTDIPVLEASETTMVEAEPTATWAPTPSRTAAKATMVPTPNPTPTEAPPISCTIAFDSDRDGNQEIYSMAPDGSQTINLTNNPAYDAEPAWSPDGRQIAFVSNRPTNEQVGGNYIYVMNADGSNVRQLTFENECARPDWSHDGSQITYSHKGDIYSIKADGSGQSVNLTNSPEWDEQPTWSPDGAKIAWLSGENGRWNIFVMNTDGSDILKLTDNGKANNVLWTIDGEIFSNWDHPDGICFNCVMNDDGSNARYAGGKGELQRYLPIKTSDGDRVECVNGDINAGNEEIYLVGEIYPDVFFNLTNNPGMDRNPDWPVNCLVDFMELNPEESAVSETESPDLKNNLLLGYAGDDPSQWQRKNNFQKACDELGIQCVYGEIPELLNKNVSAIILNSGPETIQRSDSEIREAVEKEIPVFVLDAETDINGVYSILADRSDMLRVTLDILFKDSTKSGEFAYFDYSATQMDAERIKGLLEKEYPDVRVVTSDTTAYNFKEEKYNMEELFSRYPNLKALWTNAGYTNAVFGMVESIKDPKNYPMMTCEPTKSGFYIWKDRIPDYPGFQCVAVSNPPGIAYDSVYGAYYLLNGEKIDESALGGQYGNAFVVEFPVITNENLLKELEIINFEDDKYVADKRMTPDEIKDAWFQ